MCLGSVVTLVEAWEAGGSRAGRLADGSVVTLAFVPEARPGDHLLLHTGIPLEVLDPERAREALGLRAGGGAQP